MKILVSGSLAYDRIMDFPGRFSDHILPKKIHVLSLSFLVEDLKENFGGTAGNIAYNLTLLGLKPTVLASAGKDFQRYRSWFKKFKVDLRGVKISRNKNTASAYIITDQADCQISGFYPGAMSQSVWRDVKGSRFFKGAALAISSPGNVEDMVRFPALFRRHKVPYIFDPGQQLPIITPGDLAQALKGAKVLVVNDYELALVLKKLGWGKRRLLRLVKILVTTLGERGSLIETSRQKVRIPPAKPLNTSDPTGAGDAYRAGLIRGLVSGWPLEKVGRLASVVSVYTVEKYGTQTHRFNWQSLARRYRKNFKEAL